MPNKQNQLAAQFMKRLESDISNAKEEMIRSISNMEPTEAKMTMQGYEIGVNIMRNIWLGVLDMICPECKRLHKEEVLAAKKD